MVSIFSINERKKDEPPFFNSKRQINPPSLVYISSKKIDELFLSGKCSATNLMVFRMKKIDKLFLSASHCNWDNRIFNNFSTFLNVVPRAHILKIDEIRSNGCLMSSNFFSLAWSYLGPRFFILSFSQQNGYTGDRLIKCSSSCLEDWECAELAIFHKHYGAAVLIIHWCV